MKKSSKMFWVALIAIIILGVFGFALYQRGVVYFTGWRPHVALDALKNPRPSLDRPITFPPDLTPEAQQIFNARLADTKGALRAHPDDVSSWFDLAIEYRMVEDQAGAVEIWKYVSTKYPKDGISLHNLGEYYFHTAKDYPTSEGYYMRSIAVAPQLAQNYLDLADMYTYVYRQDTDAAPRILKQGIASIASPGNFNLIMQLGGYYADHGDSKDARIYYEQALKVAEGTHKTALIQAIRQSLARLK